jgi:hypothetical protein
MNSTSSTKVSKVNTTKIAPMPDDVIKTLSAMSRKQRDKVLNLILEQGEDF